MVYMPIAISNLLVWVNKYKLYYKLNFRLSYKSYSLWYYYKLNFRLSNKKPIHYDMVESKLYISRHCILNIL